MLELIEVYRGSWSVCFLGRRGRSEAIDFIDGLPIPTQKKVVRLLTRVAAEERGPFGLHSEERFKRLGDNLYELKQDQVRLLCFMHGSRMVIVTHGFLKKTQKTPPRELTRATSIREQFRRQVET